ncbi:MAG: tetraacyldisaccharide 4'-kinase [Nitrospiraceae bacterium]|nr:tetraacyldisaccharide 4'-kinase [Nitrospiraceae bacterium]
MNILERLYYAGFLVKQRYSLAHRERLPFRVVSVGNITTGGTGKTPATMAIAREALNRGLAPVILTRGYRGKAKGPCFVTRGDGPLLSVPEAGDEPYLMASRLRKVPIVKGPDRYQDGVFAIDGLGLQLNAPESCVLFILDDGFQHVRLFRDRDVVLMDANDPFGGQRLLPAGKLREPASSLERADIIVITKSGPRMGTLGPAIEKTINTIREYNSKAPLFVADHLSVSAADRQGREYPPSALAGEKIYGFCGIGSPESFRRTLLDSGGDVAGFRNFRDHHAYTLPDILSLRREAERLGCRWIVTTEKDIIKINHLDLPENILIIRIDFSIDGSFYDYVFGR